MTTKKIFAYNSRILNPMSELIYPGDLSLQTQRCNSMNEDVYLRVNLGLYRIDPCFNTSVEISLIVYIRWG